MSQALIDLDACRHNLEIAKQAVPDSGFIAVIKANAYGHGMLAIARALTAADAFAVAHVSEAVALREAGIEKPILLLEGFRNAEELVLAQLHRLDVVIHAAYQLDLLKQAEASPLNVFLKIDTGMHRLGFDPEAVADVFQHLKQLPCVDKITLMTHLANADDKQDEKTLEQLDCFYTTTAELGGCEKSIANSAAILGWPQAYAEWQRPGIMLYGVSPFIHSRAEDHQLKPVMTLSSKLIAIKPVKKGEAIGYGSTYVCDSDKTIGIVAIGYGDGYPRHARTGTPVLVDNQRCTLLGRVSMDMICVDLTEIPDVTLDAEVILWGKGLAIEEIAESADTIAYELLCGVTRRVDFIYKEKNRT